jgi:low temperature requirement protein LtrA
LRLGGLIIAQVTLIYGMWWIYFDASPRQLTRSNHEAFLWGYGHLFIFAAAAAVGASSSVCVDALTGQTHLSETAVSLMVGIPTAVYVLGLWAIHIRACRPGTVNAAFLLGAALLVALAAVPFPWSVLGMSAIVALLVVSLNFDPAGTRASDADRIG